MAAISIIPERRGLAITSRYKIPGCAGMTVLLASRDVRGVYVGSRDCSELLELQRSCLAQVMAAADLRDKLTPWGDPGDF